MTIRMVQPLVALALVLCSMVYKCYRSNVNIISTYTHAWGGMFSQDFIIFMPSLLVRMSLEAESDF